MLLAGFLLGGVPFIAAHIELLALAVVAGSFLPAGVAVVRRRVGRARDGALGRLSGLKRAGHVAAPTMCGSVVS